MTCPHCGSGERPTQGRCSSCNREFVPGKVPQVAAGVLTPAPADEDAFALDTTRLPGSQPTIDIAALTGLSSPIGGSRGPGGLPGDVTGSHAGEGLQGGTGPLVPGQAFGARYHIIRLLGSGGMGAVYQAWDDELGVAVAVKVIRPEVLADPTTAEEVEHRFKRELLLARQVTHKNVVRIHDLGDISGIKYITMPYIQGSNLGAVLRRHGRLPVARALAIARQVASGLVAAHDAGVVHRDLKPDNIMIDGDVPLITDFGIARAIATAQGTSTGAIVGTIGYMAPEQALGQAVDQRADIYAFGLILYDMLLGRVRYASAGQTAVSELMGRMQHAPRRAHEVDPDIPLALDQTLARCLEPDPARRYQTAAELLQDLERLDVDGHVVPGTTLRAAISQPEAAPVAAPAVPAPRLSTRSKRATAAGVALLAAAAVALVVILGRDRTGSQPSQEPAAAQGEAISLAILPFRNASGDPSLDWLGSSLSEILRTEIGQSSRVRTIGSDRLRQLLGDLRISPDASFDPATLRRLAEFSNANAVMWGQFLKFGNEIRIDATLENLRTQQSVRLNAQAANQEVLVAAIGGLALDLRKSLTSSAAAAAEIGAGSSKPSSQSLMALRYYNEGVALSRQGKQSEALKQFEASTKEDSAFAIAYSRLAEAYKNLGYDNEAEQSSRKATELSSALPARERYVILASHARILGDNQKAIELYEALLKAAPEDTEIHLELARLYEDTGSLDAAREHYLRVLEDDPKSIDVLLAAGRVEIRRRQPQPALEHLNQALSLAIQFTNDEARGNILNAMGIAYKRLNKPEDALRYYQDALTIRRRLGQKGGMAASLSEIAQVNATMGQAAEAFKNHTEALAIRREIGDKRGTGNTLTDLGALYLARGEYDQALKLYRESLQIQRDVGNKSYEALLLNNIGSVYSARAQYDDALTNFERALQLREELNVPGEIAQTVHNLAEVHLKVGQYDKALANYLRALELNRSAGDQRGAAMQSYSVGNLFEYQGRYGAALSSKEEAVKVFRQLGDNSYWMAATLGGYGLALSQVGRFDEGRKTLDEALTRARALQNQVLVAQILDFQGDSYFYAGDFTTARRFFEQAQQAAAGTTDRALTLLTRASLAKLDAREKPAAAIAALTALVRQSESESLRYLSTDVSIHLGEALFALRRYDAARQELEAAVARAERLGLRALLARGHYALAEVSRASGKAPDAARHRAEAARLLADVQKEAGTETIATRADLRQILEGVPPR